MYYRCWKLTVDRNCHRVNDNHSTEARSASADGLSLTARLNAFVDRVDAVIQLNIEPGGSVER